MTHRIVILTVCILSALASGQFSGYKLVTKVLDQCGKRDDVMKCFKIQALKIADRALHSKAFNLIDGINVVQTEQAAGSRSLSEKLPHNEEKLEQLENPQIDHLLADTAARFIDTHTVQVNMPRLIEEGRGKMKKYMGPMLAAMAVKGSFMAMTYQGIALLSGTALLIGKIALVLSAILGLKKLINVGQEKSTIEIVKHPHHSQSHSYTSSYEDDGGHYHRSFTSEEEMLAQDRAYRAHIPKQ